MGSNRQTSANWLLRAIDILHQHNGQIKIQLLCEQLGISQKQFERKFKQAVGLMPKQVSRIFRLEKSRIIMRNFDFQSLTQVSHECHYTDQAHFIREFKALVQATPKQYVKEKKMSI
jgi:AraC-like DNA-binding protein